MAKYIKGSELPSKTQREILRTFVHRYTGDHTPTWVKKMTLYLSGQEEAPKYKDDTEWLDEYFFAVTISGSLDKRVKYCSIVDLTI